jgi:hypothetical protein
MVNIAFESGGYNDSGTENSDGFIFRRQQGGKKWKRGEQAENATAHVGKDYDPPRLAVAEIVQSFPKPVKETGFARASAGAIC